MNTVSLTGRLTQDPASRDTDGGTVCNMRIAIARPKGRDGNGRTADFVDVAVWGGQAGPCQKYLGKGRKVAVVGSLQSREWTAQDGGYRSRIQVRANNVEFLDSPTAVDQDASDDEEAVAA